MMIEELMRESQAGSAVLRQGWRFALKRMRRGDEMEGERKGGDQEKNTADGFRGL